MAETENLQQEDTEPSVLAQVMEQTIKLKPGEEGYDKTHKGLKKVNEAVVDQMIAEIDKKLSGQLDEILHHEDFQKLESAWRGLKFVIDRTNFSENIKIELLNVSKEDLSDDFEESPEFIKSGLYKQLFYMNYDFKWMPLGAMIANYDFGPNAPDIKLLQNVASVGAMACAPFIAAARPQFFCEDDFSRLPKLKDLKAIFEGARYLKWQSFRESEDARYVGLTLPRFLLRLPYDPENNPVKAFNYEENVRASHENYLWGNTAYAFATRLTDSFAKYRWCPNIIGPQSGGAVEDLPLYQYEDMDGGKIPTEVLITDRREYELSEEGFIALTMRKNSDNAAFFSANSAQKPKKFPNTPEGKESELNYKLGTQLPYLFIITRLVQESGNPDTIFTHSMVSLATK